MARVRVTLEIEERDLRLFQNTMGVRLPTRVVRFNAVAPGVYSFQHGMRPEAEQWAIPYTKDPDIEYPPTQHASQPLPADYQQED